jgi:hypothetical protein
VELGQLVLTFTATVLADMVVRGEVALEDSVARLTTVEPESGETF